MIGLNICSKMLICTLLWQPALMVGAATQPDVFTFTMTANVVESASCNLNEGKDVDVSFGDQVDIGQIDGLNYKTPVAYNFRCDRVGKNSVTLEIVGAEASFGQGMLAVRPGLGIRILNSDVLQPINKPFIIDANNPPALIAVPVKDSSVTLTPGDFEATATIKVIYE